MKVVIFLGPTLPHELARLECEATYVQPAAQGDVYRAVLQKPFAIGLIDGYFERLPSVWHKEILWALSEGVHVFGAASMGALRAAELARFGMRGVGDIYQAYQSGALQDDDEVAVAHGDADTSYRANSEAMVNIRATLQKAERAQILSRATAAKLVQLGKELFYPDRCYPLLLSRALEAGCASREIEALRAFLKSERVDQKRLDALALLRTMRACVEAAEPAQPVSFHFSHTDAWQEVVNWAKGQPPLGEPAPSVPSELLAAEVRLLGRRGEALLARALARAAVSLVMTESAVDAEPTGATERQAALGFLWQKQPELVLRHLVHELELSGDYQRLLERARQKQSFLREYEVGGEPSEHDPGQGELLNWYCRERLERAVPAQLADLSADLGLPQGQALVAEARREWAFSRGSAAREGIE